MFEFLIEELGPWTWWIVGFLFLILEVFAPGTVFLWLGIAALIVGTNALLLDIPWQFQLVMFAGLSVVLAVIGRRFFAARKPDEVEHTLNQRGAEYVGRTFELTEAIASGGQGRIKIGDTLWLASADHDLPEHTSVTVTAVKGTVLRVEKAG